LDPTVLDPTNSTTIQAFVPSLDGSKVALSLPSGGAMVSDLYFYDVATGRALPDVLTNVTGSTGSSLAWSADGTVRQG
jgi:prolyl oligopeptidase